MSADDRLRAFLADSLELWGIEAAVEVGTTPIVGVIRARDGTVVSVERVAAGTIPFRWIVQRRVSGAMSDDRARPCGSLVGVLSAIRNALGVERGTPLRIAPSSGDE